jgi:hypothetical protein
MTTKNPYPVQTETHKRQAGDGNTPASGEKHDQEKGARIPAERRYAGAEDAPVSNSPGRVNEDVNKEG